MSGKGMFQALKEWRVKDDSTEVGNYGSLTPSATVHASTDYTYHGEVKVDIDISADRFQEALKAGREAASKYRGNEEMQAIGIVQAIHGAYSGYDQVVKGYRAKITDVESKIDTLQDKSSLSAQEGQHLEQLNKELTNLESEKSEYYSERGNTSLSSYEDGSLVCREYGALASYLLHEEGIENHLVTGFVTHGSDDNDAGFHVYVALNESGKVVEATTDDPLNCVLTPVNSNNVIQDLKDGNPVTFASRGGSVTTYSASVAEGANFDKTELLALAAHNQNASTATEAAKQLAQKDLPPELAIAKYEHLISELAEPGSKTEVKHLVAFASDNYNALSNYLESGNSDSLKGLVKEDMNHQNWFAATDFNRMLSRVNDINSPQDLDRWKSDYTEFLKEHDVHKAYASTIENGYDSLGKALVEKEASHGSTGAELLASEMDTSVRSTPEPTLARGDNLAKQLSDFREFSDVLKNGSNEELKEYLAEQKAEREPEASTAKNEPQLSSDMQNALNQVKQDVKVSSLKDSGVQLDSQTEHELGNASPTFAQTQGIDSGMGRA